ncbi:hypothetical protein CCR75_002185 [Bremia lactucae]|uniref:Uncharacterized protein n=1 Tax=Bremia lactucae TaxID=4779 RepID=A0A976FRB7_BRELC|nr:hypothetical protein CCR75_002185 [Bremia lactucae]
MEVSFKKKVKQSRCGCKRSRRTWGDPKTTINGESDDEEHLQRSIEELREDQRLRDQVLREEHGPKPATGLLKKATVSAEATQYGLLDPNVDKSTNQKLLTLLDGQFTGQSTTTEKDQHEKRMNKFIEERLREKKLSKGILNDDASERVMDLKTAEDKLFELPEYLKPDLSSQSSMNYNDEAAEGGMLMGNAGIAEVELPASYAKKTETATQRALEANQLKPEAKLDAIGGLAKSFVPGNFSVDFNRHRADFVTELKNSNKARNDKASDDRAVSHFRNFESRKFR